MTPEKWYNFFSISGVVLDSSSKSERVYSQGYSALAGVSYRNVNVNQTTSVWIKDSSGQERKLRNYVANAQSQKPAKSRALCI